MVVTFCGHSDFKEEYFPKEEFLRILEEKVGDKPVEFLLGNKGYFDYYAHKCCLEYKKTHPNARVILVTPYITPQHQEYHLKYATDFDEIVYPPIETVPLRFAILARNQWMVDKADLLIAYVEVGMGGAYKTYMYAKRKKKEIINYTNKDFI